MDAAMNLKPRRIAALTTQIRDHPNSGVPGTKASNAAQNCER